MKKKETRDYSGAQEKYLAKLLNGKVVPNSGGGKYLKGDVVTEDFFIEAKTPATQKTSFTIKKEWLDKMYEQEFEMGKGHSALAFQFAPESENYFILDELQFAEYKMFIERGYSVCQ